MTQSYELKASGEPIRNENVVIDTFEPQKRSVKPELVSHHPDQCDRTKLIRFLFADIARLLVIPAREAWKINLLQKQFLVQ